MWLVSVTRSQLWMGSRCVKFGVITLSNWSRMVQLEVQHGTSWQRTLRIWKKELLLYISSSQFQSTRPHSNPWMNVPKWCKLQWKIMVATQNIDTLTFSISGVLPFVASGLDINGCALSYFGGTANLHCYTSCTLTTLHCSKASFLQCCHMKRYNKIF